MTGGENGDAEGRLRQAVTLGEREESEGALNAVSISPTAESRHWNADTVGGGFAPQTAGEHPLFKQSPPQRGATPTPLGGTPPPTFNGVACPTIERRQPCISTTAA